MPNVKSDKQAEVTDWSEIADLRYLSGPDLGKIEQIQAEFDFTAEEFRTRHATSPQRAIVRAEKEAELLAAWEGDNGTLLRAPWRSGKTELVFAAVENAGLAERFLFVNSQESPYPALRWRSVDDFRKIYGVREAIDHVAQLYQRLGDEVPREVIATRLDEHIGAGGNPFSFVGNIRRERGLPPALVALDEIADYARDHKQLAYLASLTEIDKVRLCFIVQKAPSIEPRYKDEFPEFQSVYLSPLTIGESAQIVRAMVREGDITFSLHGIVEIHRAAGGRPLEVSALVETCRQAATTGKHGTHFTRADIDKLVRGEMVYLTSTPLEPLVVNHIRVYEQGVTPAERALIDRLVERPHGEYVTPDNKEIVQGLVRYGLVAVANERVYLNGEIFREAVVKRMTDYRIHNYWQPDEYGNDYV